MRINPNYCKQITVENLTNRNNDQFVNVRARNVDSNRVSLHNLFYLVRSRHPSNSIYFDTLVTNSPQIRSFTLRNITEKPITVSLTPSRSDAIRLFLEPVDSNATAGIRGAYKYEGTPHTDASPIPGARELRGAGTGGGRDSPDIMATRKVTPFSQRERPQDKDGGGEASMAGLEIGVDGELAKWGGMGAQRGFDVQSHSHAHSLAQSGAMSPQPRNQTSALALSPPPTRVLSPLDPAPLR